MPTVMTHSSLYSKQLLVQDWVRGTSDVTSQMLGDADLCLQRGAVIQLYIFQATMKCKNPVNCKILCKHILLFSFLNQNSAWHIQALGKYLLNSVQRLK